MALAAEVAARAPATFRKSRRNYTIERETRDERLRGWRQMVEHGLMKLVPPHHRRLV
ncbi:hypothetical protein GUH69_04135, partial [Xanthomonas citri pv. citri]|nr:hypothetical protein [Xanthomonas citri pv. citri]